MKKISKIIRIITIAPIFALLLITLLHFSNHNLFQGGHYFLALGTLVLLPLIAYPIQNKFKIFRGDQRSSERKLAIIFSFVGYIIGLIMSFILKSNRIEKIVYLTYLLSGFLIFFFSFVIKINASGHMCGVMGPIAVMVYVLGPMYLLLTIILVFVIWSSLLLKRHSKSELALGSVIPIVSLIISIIII